jgi:hypothetical protein
MAVQADRVSGPLCHSRTPRLIPPDGRIHFVSLSGRAGLAGGNAKSQAWSAPALALSGPTHSLKPGDISALGIPAQSNRGGYPRGAPRTISPVNWSARLTGDVP